MARWGRRRVKGNGSHAAGLMFRGRLNVRPVVFTREELLEVEEALQRRLGTARSRARSGHQSIMLPAEAEYRVKDCESALAKLRAA